MAKSAVASEIDEIIRQVMVPSLKAEGMKKRGRHWSSLDAGVCRGVTVQASQSNWDGAGRFTVEVGVSFRSLGHSEPFRGAWGAAVNHRLGYLGDEPRDVWFEVDIADPVAIERAHAEIEVSWSAWGLPFLRAMASPNELCQHVAATGNAITALDVLNNVAIPLSDEQLQIDLLRRATRQARATRRWRYLDNDPHPLELGLERWSAIVGHNARLGLQLQEDALAAALAVLNDAQAGFLATPYHGKVDEEDALVVARVLGLPPSQFGKMHPLHTDQ